MNEHYKLILQRIDNYISGVNTKGGLLVAFNTFLCGSIIARYSDLKPLIDASPQPKLINLLLVMLIVLAIISVFLVGLAVYPYLKSGNSSTSKYHSLIFFNSIAEFKNDGAYIKAANECKEKEALDDVKRQIHVLANGLKKKFRFIGFAMWGFFINLIILLLIIGIILL